VAEVEADPGVGLPSDIAEDGQLEPACWWPTFSTTTSTPASRPASATRRSCSAATSRNSVSSRSAEVAWRTAAFPRPTRRRLQESALVVDDGVVDLGDVAGQPLAVREVDEQIAAGERVVETFRVDIARHERRLADPELAEVEPLRRRREPVEVVADGEPDIHAGGGCGVCL